MVDLGGAVQSWISPLTKNQSISRLIGGIAHNVLPLIAAIILSKSRLKLKISSTLKRKALHHSGFQVFTTISSQLHDLKNTMTIKKTKYLYIIILGKAVIDIV